MNFLSSRKIKYLMHKLIRAIFFTALALICCFTPIWAMYINKSNENSVEEQFTNINLWQIDGFEGGKGSRKKFLEDVAEKLFKNEKIYLTVTAISAEAAQININKGIIPDVISYHAGFTGIENMVCDKDFTHKIWCKGGYCLLTLDMSADFNDINEGNCIVNAGKNNLAEVCSSMIGLRNAVLEPPENAYLKLLNGKYKYMLGTQRDIFRLQAREAEYKVKAVSEFNDLYQVISIITDDRQKYGACKKFVDKLVVSDVSKLGLMNDYCKPEENLQELSKIDCKYKITSFCSGEYIKQVKESANSGELNKLKSLIK